MGNVVHLRLNNKRNKQFWPKNGQDLEGVENRENMSQLGGRFNELGTDFPWRWLQACLLTWGLFVHFQSIFYWKPHL